jgi:hypothetical protein
MAFQPFELKVDLHGNSGHFGRGEMFLQPNFCLEMIYTEQKCERNMSSIGPHNTMPQMSHVLRECAIGMLTAGMSTRAVARELNVHVSTICHLQCCFREFGTAIEEEWDNIPQATINSLINSMRRRCVVLHEANGCHTRY